jgi:hypothetical protein
VKQSGGLIGLEARSVGGLPSRSTYRLAEDPPNRPS